MKHVSWNTLLHTVTPTALTLSMGNSPWHLKDWSCTCSCVWMLRLSLSWTEYRPFVLKTNHECMLAYLWAHIVKATDSVGFDRIHQTTLFASRLQIYWCMFNCNPSNLLRCCIWKSIYKSVAGKDRRDAWWICQNPTNWSILLCAVTFVVANVDRFVWKWFQIFSVKLSLMNWCLCCI